MSYPFPSSFPNFFFSWKLICSLPQKAFADGIRPMDVEYLAKTAIFLNTCTFLMVVVVVLQVSAPYSRTALTLVMKKVILILVESCFEDAYITKKRLINFNL
ncbi:unnamed protein product [Schistosoma margrebowiei]|uniref:Uncharacterized protein n=1 Tax=Schistosoma margrebowiei TaxID=48269 RepID=A0AA84ZUE6_9TREM|nr:unnamed protein product [Schistosoma margrebowiei]